MMSQKKPRGAPAPLSHLQPQRRWPKTPSGETLHLINQAARLGTERLVAAFGIPIGERRDFDPSNTQWRDPVSILGFVSDDMAGSVIVSAPWPLIGSMCPTGTDDTEALVDWSRELANLLAGSFKSTLLSYGVTLEIGLPTSVVSHSMRIELVSARPLGHRYALGDQDLLVVFDVRLSETCALRVDNSVQPVEDFLLF